MSWEGGSQVMNPLTLGYIGFEIIIIGSAVMSKETKLYSSCCCKRSYDEGCGIGSKKYAASSPNLGFHMNFILKLLIFVLPGVIALVNEFDAPVV